MTQIKTAENQMSISQQCTNTIFIAKNSFIDEFFYPLLSDILSWHGVPIRDTSSKFVDSRSILNTKC